MQKTIYIKDDNKAMFLKYIGEHKIYRYYLLPTKNIIFKVLKKLNILYFLLGKWKYRINEYNYFILGENYYFPFISKYIKKRNPDCKVVMFFWNIIGEHKIYEKILQDPNIDEFWTFDKKDAQNYNMKQNSQFYTKNLKLDKGKNEYEVLFLGRAKNRKKEIEDLKQYFIKMNIIINFKIIQKEKDYVSYDEYLKMLSKSKCILDYNQNGQVGLSLRPMESIFLKKKLITNNKDIVNYDFYNPKNIFVIGIDDMNKIKEFINSPYEEIEQKIIDYYDFESWIKRFEDDKNEF